MSGHDQAPQKGPRGMSLTTLSHDELTALCDEQRTAYDELVARNLALDLTRGKPAPDQLDLSAELLELPGVDRFRDNSGADCRNYGGLAGLVELREIFSTLLNIPVAQLIAGGNASLTMMVAAAGHQVPLPRAGVRPALHGVRAARHRDDPRPDAGGRSQYDGRVPARRR